MKMTGFHIYIIGILLLNFYAGGSIAHAKEQMVIVEPANILTTEKDGNYSLRPYRERRPAWGKTISVGYSNYEPVNYQPDFLQVDFADIYQTPEIPMLELTFAVKKNSPSISWGGELSVGLYQNESDERDLIQSTLQVIPIKLGAILLLDALGPEPNFVPYVSGGAYTVIYKEDNNNVSFTGNTQVAPYLNVGMAFSLGWIDKDAARTSFEDSGIEASYAFIEARTMFEAGDEQDPDFSSQINFAGGIRVEF